MTINISVDNKRPTVSGSPVIVCDNADYEAQFTFDSEWDGLNKTARFAYVSDGTPLFTDVALDETDKVAIPAIQKTRLLCIGVYAADGDLRTTTPAEIPCKPSIKSVASETPITPSQYEIILGLLEHKTNGGALTTPNLWELEAGVYQVSGVKYGADESEILSFTGNRVLAVYVDGESVHHGTIREDSKLHLLNSCLVGSTVTGTHELLSTEAPQYGVCIDLNTKSKTLVRLDSSVGLISGRGFRDKPTKNDFDKIAPWKDIRRCTLADDGTVTSYEGDANYTEDGSIGQVMVEFPKFYYKRELDESENKEYIWFCSQKLEGYSVPPFFTDKNGNEVDTFYLGAFETSMDEDDKAQSVSGAVRKTFNYYELNSSAQARGTNWHNIDIAEYSILFEMAFMIEFATTDTESVFGGTYSGYQEDLSALTDELTGDISTLDIDLQSFSEPDCLELYEGEVIDFTYYVPDNVSYDVPERDELIDEQEIEGVTWKGYEGLRTLTAVAPAADRIRITIDEHLYLSTQEDTFMGSVEAGKVTNETGIIVASSGVLIRDSSATSYNSRSFLFRGLENPFSNSYTWVNGIFSRNGKYFVTTDLSDYPTEYTARLIPEGATELGYLTPKANGQLEGYITQAGFDNNVPWAMLPTILGGSYQEGYCDKSVPIADGTQYDMVVRLGGSAPLDGGVFCLAATPSSSARLTSNASRGRLAYRHFE